MSRYRVDFDSIEWDSPMVGVRGKIDRQDGKQLRLVEYTDDMPPHWCEKGHIGYMLAGRFEIAFEDEVVTFEPGDGIFIPSGPEHKHMARTLTDMVRVVFVEDA